MRRGGDVMDEPGREASVTWRDSWSTTPRCPSCCFDARPDHQAGSPGPRARRGRLEGGRGPNAVRRGTRPARRVRRLHRPAQRKTVRTPRGRGPHPIPWPWCSTRRSGITPVLIDNAPVILVGKHYVSVISPGPLRHRPGGDRAPLVPRAGGWLRQDHRVRRGLLRHEPSAGGHRSSFASTTRP